ncbi:MAG: hypothetical protein ACYC49_10600 [Ignavibacteriaceae bacterium]
MGKSTNKNQVKIKGALKKFIKKLEQTENKNEAKKSKLSASSKNPGVKSTITEINKKK